MGAIQGSTYDRERVSRVTKEHTYGTWRKQGPWNPLVVERAEGVYFYDKDGKAYLDFSSQLMCSNLGHSNSNVIEAMHRQAEKLAYIQPSYTIDARAELAEELSSVLPGNLDRFFFGTSGTEANEAAVKIIRMYNSSSGKVKIISMYNSYHGSTAASISLTGDFRRIQAEPDFGINGVVHAPPPYCYRCPFGLKYPDCGLACADYIEYMIKNEGNVGGLIMEPVTGTNGVVIPPPGYMERVREITEENDVIMVTDEVMSGWGRTGEWFAVDHWNIKPDILTTAKGITSAYFPLSLTATDRRISEYFEDHYFAHGHTYEAHPVGMAAATAAIREYKRLNLIERAREMGKYLSGRLEELRERHPSVGDVRSIGLFAAVEIVRNRETREPFNTYRDKVEGRPLMTDRIASEMMKKGVYVNTWVSHFVIAPPLIITKEEIDAGVSAMDDALRLADSEVK